MFEEFMNLRESAIAEMDAMYEGHISSTKEGWENAYGRVITTEELIASELEDEEDYLDEYETEM